MADRIRVAMLFGGRSAEHEVSILSAANVFRALDPERYAVTLIGITRDAGTWKLCPPDLATCPAAVPLSAPDVAFVPGGKGRLVGLGEASPSDVPGERFDVVVPVLHGPNGEDGTLQGVLEVADVAYVGSGVLGSAIAMDKDVSKRLLIEAGLPVVPHLASTRRKPVGYDAAVAALGTSELFVKPANMGSSVGVSRAASPDAYARAAELAFRYDDKILVERCISRAREIECSVLETSAGEVRVSPPGEIAPAAEHGYYSYDAKYVDADGARLLIPADISADVAARIRHLAARSFEVLCCSGLARIDFFLDRTDDLVVYVNEVNTLPGFTAISMYPKLWAAAGLEAPTLMDELIAEALARHRRKTDLV